MRWLQIQYGLQTGYEMRETCASVLLPSLKCPAFLSLSLFFLIFNKHFRKLSFVATTILLYACNIHLRPGIYLDFTFKTEKCNIYWIYYM